MGTKVWLVSKQPELENIVIFSKISRKKSDMFDIFNIYQAFAHTWFWLYLLLWCYCHR